MRKSLLGRTSSQVEQRHLLQQNSPTSEMTPNEVLRLNDNYKLTCSIAIVLEVRYIAEFHPDPLTHWSISGCRKELIYGKGISMLA